MSLGRWVRALRGVAAARVRGDDAAWERQRRELALLALDGAADLVTFRRDGLLWTTTAVRHTITRNLFVHGRHPRREVEALGAWLRARGRLGPGRPWAVDVGANVGAPTLFFARDLGRRVLAIEPVPANFELLRRNVDANGFGDRVVCVAAAVAPRPGVVTMLRPAKDGQCEVGTEAARERLAAEGAVASVEVPARPLDDLLAAHGVAPSAVAYAWSDTQGFETEVLRSGTSLWRAGVPAFVEAWPDGLEAHGGVAAFVTAAETSFARFVTSRDLVSAGAEAPERPVGDLGPFLRALDRQTDVLLVPPSLSAASG
jgi:FkbM family methyltransferase